MLVDILEISISPKNICFPEKCANVPFCIRFHGISNPSYWYKKNMYPYFQLMQKKKKRFFISVTEICIT